MRGGGGEMGMERGRRTPEEGEQRGLEYIECIPFFNSSQGRKCPFGSLAPLTHVAASRNPRLHQSGGGADCAKLQRV